MKGINRKLKLIKVNNTIMERHVYPLSKFGHNNICHLTSGIQVFPLFLKSSYPQINLHVVVNEQQNTNIVVQKIKMNFEKQQNDKRVQ